MNYQCESIVKTLLANYLRRNKLRLNELDYTNCFSTIDLRFYLLLTYPCFMYSLGFTFSLLLTYPSSMYSLGFILGKGTPFLFLVFRDGYRKVYRNKYLQGGFDRW